MMTIPANDGRRTMRVGVWNYYEEITTDGFLFKNTEASIGAGLLKPWVDLHRYGQQHGIEFVTLDQVAGVDKLDAIIFMDRPRRSPIVDQLMAAPIAKYLLLYECEVIKPDNWELDFHQHFDRIFTWSDVHCDGRRYVKINFAIETNTPFDFEELKAQYGKRKMASIVAGAKASRHPYELYSDRVRAIRWFEGSAPNDLDLYGGGWDPESFPSYRGRVDDKLATMAKYNFAICYENAKNIPGYITEKILDCFRAGTVPVYGGAPNIARWVPQDCFIDISQFQTYGQMHAHLADMPPARHGQYLDRIRHFLYGHEAYPFSSECFVATVTSFVAFDVQNRRGETPVAAPEQRTPGTTLAMVQDLETMEIAVVEEVAPLERRAPAMTPRESIAAAQHPELIVYLGYGEELPVFTRTRALWEFYLSHFPGIKAFFVRDSDTLALGEVAHNGHDLLVGTRRDDAAQAQQAGYRQTGIWSANENASVIRKQMAVFDYVLRKHGDKPFYLYHATVTSVVDFRGLVAIMEQMPATGCFAGMPGRLNNPPELAGLNFICGTNSLFSRDMVQLLRNRYDPADPMAALPNDIWQSMTLRDIPRQALPFFSFVKPRAADARLDDVAELTRHLLADGHFHFRVKTTSEEEKLARREDVDPWVMLKIMETILTSPAVPEKNRELRAALQAFTSDAAAGFPAFADKPIFGGPRNFALTELEAPVLYSHRA
jgi:hypothetical protein